MLVYIKEQHLVFAKEIPKTLREAPSGEHDERCIEKFASSASNGECEY